MKHAEQVTDEPNLIARHGRWVALAAAAALTAKGEYDLAVLAHYPKEVAWLFAVALDVYAASAYARKARVDVIAGLLLMITCQVAFHLTDLRIQKEDGEQVPWGLVMLVSCVPPIVAWRAHSLGAAHRKAKSAELLAAEESERVAREAAAEADRRRVETAARLRAEQEARVAERQAVEARLQEERQAREAAELAARDAKEKADRAAFRASRASTQRDGDAVTRRTPTTPVTQPVTHKAEPTDAPVTHGVTHPVTHNGDAPAGGDAQTSDAPLTRDERLTLAVMEVLEGTSPSARAAALKHDVDVQAVQRRVRVTRAAGQTQEARPLARPAVNGVEPKLTGTP